MPAAPAPMMQRSPSMSVPWSSVRASMCMGECVGLGPKVGEQSQDLSAKRRGRSLTNSFVRRDGEKAEVHADGGSAQRCGGSLSGEARSIAWRIPVENRIFTASQAGCCSSEYRAPCRAVTDRIQPFSVTVRRRQNRAAPIVHARAEDAGAVAWSARLPAPEHALSSSAQSPGSVAEVAHDAPIAQDVDRGLASVVSRRICCRGPSPAGRARRCRRGHPINRRRFIRLLSSVR